jgi:hypothetical protein
MSLEEKDGTLIRIKVPMIDSKSNKIRFKVAYWSRYCDYLAIQGDITLPINYRNGCEVLDEVKDLKIVEGKNE